MLLHSSNNINYRIFWRSQNRLIGKSITMTDTTKNSEKIIGFIVVSVIAISAYWVGLAVIRSFNHDYEAVSSTQKFYVWLYGLIVWFVVYAALFLFTMLMALMCSLIQTCHLCFKNNERDNGFEEV
jgi:hypothetical protein